MSYHPPLAPDVVYHIYNRGNNSENLFREERNYHYFMELYARYIVPIAETYAYCLLPNHFHLMVRIREAQDCQSLEDWQSYTSHAFSNLFSTYTKAINKAYNRSGSLFEKPFKRKPVTNNRYFKILAAYIHQNPQRHGLIDDFRNWPFSSYSALLSDKPTQLAREQTLAWFEGTRGLAQYHEAITNFKGIIDLIEDD